MNEIQQQIQFFKSKLNWDVDISLLQDGDSKYFLNTVPAASEHAGVRSNCLGTTEKVSCISIASPTTITVTTSNPTTSTVQFEFALSSVPGCLWVEVLFRGQLKHIFIKGAGYATVPTFITYAISEVRKHFAGNLYSYGTITNGCYFVFEKNDTDSMDMLVRTCGTAIYPTTLKVIGAHYYSVQDVTYYWTYDTSAFKMGLFQYVNYNDIMFEMPLALTGVTKSSLVISSFIVGSDRDALLYWNYYQGTAHKINIYDCITEAISFTDDSTNIIKPPPATDDLTITAYASDTYKNNDQYYQVLARNKFRDGELSVFGNPSVLLYSNYGENSIGFSGPAANKTYDLDISDDTHNEWSKYEFALKTGDGEWRLIEPVLNSVTGLQNINGADVVYTVPESDIVRLFDYVPQSIGSIELLGNNRMGVVDCTEGYPNVDLSVTATSVVPSTSLVYVYTLYRDATLASGNTGFFFSAYSSSASGTRVMYFKTANGEYFVHLHNDEDMSFAQIQAYFVNYIKDNIIPIDPIITNAVASTNGVDLTNVGTLLDARYMHFYPYYKLRSFPHGVNYLGIVYYDKFGRCGGVNIDDNLAVTVPVDNNISYVTLTISHLAPTWATHYRIFYGGSSKQQYQQIAVKKENISIEDRYTKIYINDAVIAGQVINSSFNIGSYVFNEGDRIRLLQHSKVETVGSLKYLTGEDVTSIIDTEILSQDEAAIYIPNISNAAVIAELAANDYFLVELYTPRKDKPVDYYETPYWGTITNRYHNYFYNAVSGYTQTNQGASTSMTATIGGFDHTIYQTFYMDSGKPASFWVLSESFSNYFSSKTKGLGRVNFYSSTFNTLRRNVVRASNIYIPQTDINGLSTFEYANEQVVDESYGRVAHMKLVGDVLKIIQPNKISSMYIGGEIGVDASGNEVLLSSSKILTTPRYNKFEYGSLHPESIVVHWGYMYALDVINSVVWRDTPGGTYAISENGMRSYFKYKIQQLIASCGYSFKAYGGYDYHNELYLITFKDPYNSANNETIGFHEPSETWYSFYSFLPEMYCGIPGDYLMSFNAGKLYLHSNTTRNSFYGTAYNSVAWIVGNVNPDTPKRWTSLAVNSTYVWTAVNSADILVDADMTSYMDVKNHTTHKGAMQSALSSHNFRYYNGDFIASFLRDGTSTSSTFSSLDLIKGRQLMGKTILIKLSNSSTVAVYLKGVKINAQIAR